MQYVSLKHKQNWINHLEITDNTRPSKHTLKYEQRGRRDRGRPKKRRQCVNAGTVQTTQTMEEEMIMMTFN
jgi:hypothetical protein